MQRSLKLQTTKIDNKLCDSHKRKQVLKALLFTGLETNARPLARGELNSVRASGSSDLTSPVGEWEFFGDLSIIS